PMDALQPRTRETALHMAVCGPDASAADRVVQVLLAAGADPNANCAIDVPTHSLMRDARTRGEAVLHRAAAFANLATVERLLKAGADPLARDAHGDTPLAWASWARRPVELLRALLHEGVEIHPDYRPLRENLLGDPG
ncbi:MAG: ankyrin repeat domain-containing protein, partial [Inhella sp.]